MLYRSTDGGSVWEQVDSYYDSGYDMIHSHENTFWSCGSLYESPNYKGVVSHTTDGGSSWTRHELFSSTSYSYIKTLAVDPSNPDRVFCMKFQSGSYGLYYTEDGGGSWQSLSPSGYSGTSCGLAVCPADGNLIASATSAGLYASDDAGANWYRVTTLFSGANDVYHSEQLGGLLVSTDNDGVWLWEDWTGTPAQFGDDLYSAVHCVEEGSSYLYAGTEGAAVWRTYILQGIEGKTNPIPDITITVSPNPVLGGAASVSFMIPAQQQTTLCIYDLSGRLVMTAAHEVMSEGMNRISIDTSALTSGMYFARLTTGNISATARMVIVR